MIKMTIHLKHPLAADTRDKARAAGKSLSGYIRDILNADLQANSPDDTPTSKSA